MKQVKIAIVGNGERASCYCRYALTNPSELSVAAIVDPNPQRRAAGAKLYGVEPRRLYESVQDFLRAERETGERVDCVVNATMDELHYETVMPILAAGYPTLLEKPIVNNTAQLLEIRDTAKAHDCFLMICHVLRYTPFYQSIKEVILSGEIGEIMHVETCEHVGIAHASNSYIRGKWNSTEKCGSSMLLAKCCHDLDMICWLNNTTKPVRAASFGGRSFLVPEKAPLGAGTRCLNDCAHVDTCQFSAKAIYVDNDRFPWYSRDGFGKDYRDVTQEEFVEALRTDHPHGVCAYRTDSDLVDHQAVMVRFDNGSTATHSMIQTAVKPCRKITILGTRGEIEGEIETSRFVVRTFDQKTALYQEHDVDVSKLIAVGDHHAGGDAGIIQDFVRVVRGESPSISCTKIDDSIAGHLCVFAADQSMREDQEIEISAE